MYALGNCRFIKSYLLNSLCALSDLRSNRTETLGYIIPPLYPSVSAREVIPSIAISTESDRCLAIIWSGLRERENEKGICFKK